MKSRMKNLFSVAVLCLSLVSVSVLSGCAAGGNSAGGQNGSGQTGSGQNGSGQNGSGQEDGKISVVTTIFPPYDFVREIAGDAVDLKMLLKPGEETHSYEPTPQDIIAIQNCDVFIYTGGENDVWVEDILSSMPDEGRLTLRLVDCVETVEEERVEGMKGTAGHSHEESEESRTAEDAGDDYGHVHTEDEEESVHEIDEHVWTSPVNAAQIVEEIRDLLSEADRANRDLYARNAAGYEEKLRELDREFREVVETSERSVLIFGDRFPFRYFADEYGLDYYAAFPGCAGDTEPSAATMAFLIEKVKEEKVPAVLKMELSNADIANAIAEATKTKVKVLYSCHNLSADDFENGETYLSMMQKNVDTLKEVLN